MASSVDQFAKAMIAAGLFTADEVKAIWNSLPQNERPATGKAFAKWLNDHQKLTKFQAEQILTGSKTPLVLGDYHLLARIGAGGMGQVFKAQHRHMKRLVAIKLLPPALTRDEAAIKRFQREVEAAAKLSHPNIVQAYDASVQRGVWYLVMEYVEGRDLSAVVAVDGPLAISRAVNYIRQSATGLAFAHSKGIVHRDIKPANLLLCDLEGTIKILDMGLARFEDATAAKDGLTESGQVMGTVDFMAPEQAFDVHHADARADVYSLGCTLYRLLTGRNLYDADSLVKKLMAHQSQPIPSLAAYRPDVPPVLVAIFERMVAKQPAQRYQTMAEVNAALDAVGPAPSSHSAVGPTSDPELSSFLRSFPVPKSQPGSQSVTTAPQPHNTARPSGDPYAATISLNSAHVATDPIPERSLQVAREHLLSIHQKSKLWWQKPLILTAVGLSVVLLFALGAWSMLGRKQELPNVPKQLDAPQLPANTSQAQGNPSPPNPSTQPLAIAKAPFSAAQAKRHQQNWASNLGLKIETMNSVGASMILIPPGEFMQGSTDAQVEFALSAVGAVDSNSRARMLTAERPQHRVVITRPFLMSATEVTVGQFKRFSASGYVTEAEQEALKAKASPQSSIVPSQPPVPIQTYLNPGYFVNDESPAAVITWNDALAFCNWLSRQENLEPCYVLELNKSQLLPNKNGYHIPTDAQWEYACRAGTTTQYSFGDDHWRSAQYAWYSQNADRQSHPVARKLPNPFGLFDMHGNLQEWCQDYYDETWYATAPTNDPVGPLTGSNRVVRGGYWLSLAASCRSAYRSNYPPFSRFHSFGFRLVRDLTISRLGATSATLPQPSAVKVQEVAPPSLTTAQVKQQQQDWANRLATKIETTNSVGAKLILIPPGEFQMGSTDSQVNAAVQVAGQEDDYAKRCIQTSERPQHRVVITKPFLMGATEVTVGQFKKFSASGYVSEGEKALLTAKSAPPPPNVSGQRQRPIISYANPGYVAKDEDPAIAITWSDAVAYCNWLSGQEGHEPSYVMNGDVFQLQPNKNGYRLPTEAEWEYACRAGTTTQFSFGDDHRQLDQYAWYRSTSGGRPQPVGTKPANPFGLFDMHGNAQEWCHDLYDSKWYEMTPTNDPTGPIVSPFRVLRGGSWYNHSSYCRSAFRTLNPPGEIGAYWGFRYVRNF